ncbi:aminotransferase class V-fold PLP-dependent enzyme [soil metagenome]
MDDFAPPTIDPADENYWAGIRRQYDVSDDFVNLENGYFSIPSRPVLAALDRHTRQINREGPFFMRNRLPERLAAVTQVLAGFTGVDEHELVITRNATEAMNILIHGYPFKPADELVMSTQDYDRVIDTARMAQKRRGIQLRWIQLPLHPRDDEEIVAAYEAAISARTRVLLVTHMIHLSGQIVPVAKIARMARERGVDVMVDAAHSFAQIDFRLPDLEADFIACNLHKWLGAPLGSGVLYVRKERIADIERFFGEVSCDETDIRKLANFGTTPPAAILSIPDAVDFHNQIGAANKEARLRYLKDYWGGRVRNFGGIDMLTPDARKGPQRSCAIASFCVAGQTSKQVTDYLYDEHRIYTVALKIEGREAVRVTPHLFTSTGDLDRLLGALEKLV